jgi:hypothetical protein
MAVTPEKVLRRVRAVIGTTGNERSTPAVTRLVLRVLLFDNQPFPAWREHAACAEIGAEVFYPDPNQAGDAVAAKRICTDCPVRVACLVDVLGWESSGRRHGIAGGLTPTERTRLVAAQRGERGGQVAA